MIKKKIKVLIIDDAALIRVMLEKILGGDSRIEVVACAKDPYEARDLIKVHNPDVLTLDIEMPKMNGLAFLKNIMRLRPMPVVMISTLTSEGAPATLEALEIGAVDFVPKPSNDGESDLSQYSETIIEKVVSAARSRVRAREEITPKTASAKRLNAVDSKSKLKRGFICAIGASTGGTEAIKEVVSVLPENAPPIVITQHIPGPFSLSFSRRVNGCSAVEVCQAEHNQQIKPGHVYIAPGDKHLTVELGTMGYVCKLDDGDLVNRHKPSVEVLFDSVLAAAGKSAMSVMLTGMGADGALAMLRMREAGCVTAAQDEDSSVVWGMPGAAFNLGAVSKVLSLNKIPRFIIHQAYQ